MRLPTELHIGGMTYTTELVTTDLRNEQDEKLCGEIDYIEAKVRIKAGMSDARTLQTLMHECVHGIANAACMYPSEDDVDRMASGIIALFRENPKLARLYLEMGKK